MFIHYSNVNIHDCSLLDALKTPLFMAYHDGQPFNDNLLRPCPILENQNMLAEMVERTGAHSTDLRAKESARDLCAKCSRSIEEWAPVAERLWSDPSDPMHAKRQDPTQGMADSDMDKLRAQGRR